MKNIAFLLLILLLSACAQSDPGLEPQDEPGLLSDIVESISEVMGADIGLPDCAGQLFTQSPVDLDLIHSITPLGNLNPPQHTLPTQHMYFHPVREDDIPLVLELYAPGDVDLFSINTTIYFQDGAEISRDFGIRFALCDGQEAYFLHINELSPELNAQIAKGDCESSETFEDGSRYEYCRDELNFQMEAGELIGMVGGPPYGTFDLGLSDDSTRLNYANPQRYTEEMRSMVCPIDYFEEAVRAALTAKLEGGLVHPCGEVMQDIVGRLAGNWFFSDLLADNPSGWEAQLSFAQDNLNRDRLVISVGGIFMQASRWEIKTSGDGLVNQPFEDVGADGMIYCYESEQKQGRILVQLMSDNELQIEHQTNKCVANISFTEAVVYRR